MIAGRQMSYVHASLRALTLTRRSRKNPGDALVAARVKYRSQKELLGVDDIIGRCFDSKHRADSSMQNVNNGRLQ